MSICWNTSSMGGVTRSQSIKQYLTSYNSHYCWGFCGLDSLQQANTFILSGSCHWHVFNFISWSCMQINVCVAQIQMIKKTMFCLCKDRSCLSSHKFGAVLKSKWFITNKVIKLSLITIWFCVKPICFIFCRRKEGWYWSCWWTECS